MRVSGNPVLTAISSTYIYLFRGTPMLIQLIFWFNLAIIMPVVSLDQFKIDAGFVRDILTIVQHA